MNVLVCVPYRHGTPRMFIEATIAAFSRFTFGGRELAMWPNEICFEGRHYGAHAQARNSMIEAALCPRHTHVLWLDVDLVKVPAGLIGSLAAVDPCGVVAPFVFVEKLDKGQGVSRENGGWFYDTGGFIKGGLNIQEERDFWPGYSGGPVDVDSVGCCYLIPAEVYRRGVRYDPRGDEVEHVSLMRECKRLGYRIQATDGAVVEHAFLPKYGVPWRPG